jgi:hypothetical protein
MNSFQKSVCNLTALASVTLAMSACGNSSTSTQFLKNVDLQVTQVGTDSFLKLTSTFDLGNVSLAQMDISIVDPHTQVERGTVSFAELGNGQAQISVSANASLLANADATLGQTMPNGKPLPLALGAQAGQVLGIKLLEHSTVYLGGDTNTTAYAGVALGIQGFDQVMNQLSSAANIFFMGNFTPQVMGVGGIYGSTVANESGIAIFGKYTNSVAVAKTMNVSKMDQNADYEIEKLNSNTMKKLTKFFYGRKQKLKFY